MGTLFLKWIAGGGQSAKRAQKEDALLEDDHAASRWNQSLREGVLDHAVGNLHDEESRSMVGNSRTVNSVNSMNMYNGDRTNPEPSGLTASYHTEPTRHL